MDEISVRRRKVEDEIAGSAHASSDRNSGNRMPPRPIARPHRRMQRGDATLLWRPPIPIGGQRDISAGHPACECQRSQKARCLASSACSRAPPSLPVAPFSKCSRGRCVSLAPRGVEDVATRRHGRAVHGREHAPSRLVVLAQTLHAAAAVLLEHHVAAQHSLQIAQRATGLCEWQRGG
eukprot:910358-Pleurochrysis_carterae.AAC.5